METAPVCILAGGLGSRLGEGVKDTPKPLLEVAGEPFLIHQLRHLAAHGIHRVVLCVGYLGDHIEDAIGHSQFDMEIDYSYDGPELLGTLGAIRRAVPLLGQRFLTLYGDTYLRVDFQAFDAAWRTSGLPGAMTVLRNYNEWGPSNAVFSNGLITQFDKQRPTPSMEWIDYGLGGLEITTLDIAPEVTDLAVLHHRLAQQGNLFGFEASHRFYEIGTPASLEETERFLTRRRRDEAMGK